MALRKILSNHQTRGWISDEFREWHVSFVMRHEDAARFGSHFPNFSIADFL